MAGKSYYLMTNVKQKYGTRGGVRLLLVLSFK